MIIFILIITVVMLIDAKPAGINKYHDACSHEQTANVNAVFTLLIIISHASMYLDLNDNPLDISYNIFRNYAGQFVVAPFLFFSGYGIMKSISNKGCEYIKSFPKNRLFKVWYHFILALIPYIIMYLSGNISPNLSQILLSLIGIRSLGNSYWYMFDTFLMYIIIYLCFTLCFKIFKKSKQTGVIFVFISVIPAYLIMNIFDMSSVFYTTIFCMPAGMIFCLIQKQLHKIITKNDFVFYTVFIALCVTLHFLQLTKFENAIIYNIFSIIGTLIVIMFCMKIKTNNKILNFFSKHIFSIYILQRIPMIVLDKLNINQYEYLFVILSIICTVPLACIFDKLTEKTDEIIYKKQQKTKAVTH